LAFEPEKTHGVARFVFQRQRVPTFDLFVETLGNWIATEAFVRIVQANKLTGWKFYPVWSDEPEQPDRLWGTDSIGQWISFHPREETG
jgi:hypothetical protein